MYIAGYFVRLIDGKLDPIGMTTEDISRAGVDYASYRTIGLRGQMSRLLTLSDYATPFISNQAILTFKQLQGQYVTIVDETGATWPACFINMVTPRKTSLTGTIAGQTMSGVQSAANILIMEWQVTVNG